MLQPIGRKLPEFGLLGTLVTPELARATSSLHQRMIDGTSLSHVLLLMWRKLRDR
jgi:hypothetical protein